MTKQIERRKEDVVMALIQQDLEYIKKDVGTIKQTLSKDYITRKEFELAFSPIQRIVYGIVGLILTGVVGALISLVVMK